MAKTVLGSAHSGMMFGFRWTWDWPPYTLDQEPVPIVGFRRSIKSGGRVSIIAFGPLAIVMVRLLNRDVKEKSDG